MLWQRTQSSSASQNPTKLNLAKRRSSFHLASSMAQYARVSSGLATFKRSTKTSMKVFKTLLSEVSEGETDDFEPNNVRQIKVQRQSTCSSFAEFENGVQPYDSLLNIDDSNYSKGKGKSTSSSSLFSRFFNWRKSSCEEDLEESKSPSNLIPNELKKRSVSEEELLAFLERNPDFEGRIQLQSIPTHLKEVDNMTKPQHSSISLGTMISKQEGHFIQRKKVEQCTSFPIIQTAEYKSGWQKKCSQSFSYGEGIVEPHDAKFERKIASKPARTDTLHVKLQRYKTFHGQSRKEHHFHKQTHQHNLLLQVQMMLFVSHFFFTSSQLFFDVFDLHLIFNCT